MGRPVTERTPQQDAQLARLVEASRGLDQAKENYRRQMIACDNAGLTRSAVAEALGVSIESVRRYLARNR